MISFSIQLGKRIKKMSICPLLFSNLHFFNAVLQCLGQKSWAMLRKIGRFSKIHLPAVTHKTNVRHIKPIKLPFLKKSRVYWFLI